MKLLREIMFPVIAVLAAFIVGGIVVWIIGDNRTAAPTRATGVGFARGLA